MVNITKEDFLLCAERIKPYVHNTPVLSSTLLNEIAGCELYFKCENFQKMGAFKMRGATNAILSLSDEEKSKGVVTHSSGNFAQAVALAAQKTGVKAFIVMPSNVPKVKVDAVKDYGGHVIICESSIDARERVADEVALEKGATLLHPSNQIEVIIGQGTAAIELFEIHKDLDYLITPVGGGGLLAGCAKAAHLFGNGCNTIAAEPTNVDDAFRSLKSGKIETNTHSNTIADGLRTNLGDVNFPLIQAYVEEIILVEEEEIVEAMRLIWERMKIIVEPSSAITFASVVKKKQKFKDKKVGLILSGGNVDLSNLPF